MPGSVNISIKLSTYEKLVKAKPENYSWSDFLEELLSLKDKPVQEVS